MHTTKALVCAILLGGWLPGASAQRFGLPGSVVAEPRFVQSELLAARTALVPGEPIELAVRLEIGKGWHIYWRNPGESGMKPRFRWELPPGFEVGPLLFPAPSRHIDPGPIHTFILEGEPVILTTLTVPADLAPGKPVTLSVNADWLVCKPGVCMPVSQSLSLMLPVAASKADSKPVHEDVFRAAHRALPRPVGKALHLDRLRAAASVDKVKPGAKFQVAVVLEIPKDHHLTSHKPLDKSALPTDLFHDRTEGLTITRPRFPAGKVEDGPLGQQSVYRGRTVIILPVEANEDLAGSQVRISGVVAYLACSDKTNACFPPAAAEWELTLPVAAPGEQASAANAELFKGAAGFTLDSDVRADLVRKEYSLLAILGLALLAGLILNVTPCVLPVISIKVLSFVQQASESPARVLKLGLAFSVGMLIAFNVLAVLATAAGLVWGQHFQSPVFTVVMAGIVFAFGLSLFGVYTLGVPRAVGDVAARAEGGEGYVGSIAKGILATAMGTPCLGPFLGSVLVWTATQAPGVVFLVFNTIGVGMALPYVLLTANPRWLRFVPKPGPWLEGFKQAMGFLLMGTVVYLLYILSGQLGGSAVIWALVWFIGVGIACWMVGRWITVNASPARRAVVLLIALLLVGGSGRWAYDAGLNPEAEPDAAELEWVPFSMDRLEERTASGKTVFLDITADWCPNCKGNLAVVFNTTRVKAVVQELGVVPMLADWTARDETIGKLINALAPGASVPLCAVFPAGRPNRPIVMLGLVTRQQVIDALREAASGAATRPVETAPAP